METALPVDCCVNVHFQLMEKLNCWQLFNSPTHVLSLNGTKTHSAQSLQSPKKS